MVNLPDAVLVLVPAATFGPHGTCRIADTGDGPSIVAWDASSLGPQPTDAQLAAVTDAEVAAYQAGQVIAGAASLIQGATPLRAGVATGDIVAVQRLNELVQYLANEVVPRLNSLLPGGNQVPPFAPLADVTAIPPTPHDLTTAGADAGNILAKKPGWTLPPQQAS